MTKTIFEEMGGTYRQVGDYLLPNITVPAEEEIEPIGLWGKRHARHLKEHYNLSRVPEHHFPVCSLRSARSRSLNSCDGMILCH